MRISDWSSDVCSSDLSQAPNVRPGRSGPGLWLSLDRTDPTAVAEDLLTSHRTGFAAAKSSPALPATCSQLATLAVRRSRSNGRNIDGSLRLSPLASRLRIFGQQERDGCRSGIRSRHGGRGNMSELATIGYEGAKLDRSEEHTSELQSLMRTSYAV